MTKAHAIIGMFAILLLMGAAIITISLCWLKRVLNILEPNE